MQTRRRRSAEERLRLKLLWQARRVERAEWTGNNLQYKMKGGIPEYSAMFRVQLQQAIDQRVKRSKKTIRVLDIGAGEGIFLAQLIKKYGQEKIGAYGIGLQRPYDKKSGQVWSKALADEKVDPARAFRKYHTGVFGKRNASKWFNQPGHQKKFDIITCLNTAIEPEEIHTIAELLAPGGKAYVHVSLNTESAIDRFHGLPKGCSFTVLRKENLNTHGIETVELFLCLTQAQ